MPNSAPRTRITPASPPGAMTVLAWTVESYCSNTQRLEATGGWSRSRSSTSSGAGSGTLCAEAGDRLVLACGRVIHRAVLDQPPAGDLDHDLIAPRRPVQA